MTITITAATGQLGRLAVDALIARGVAPEQIVAAVRTPAKAADLAAKGVQVREADYAYHDGTGSTGVAGDEEDRPAVAPAAACAAPPVRPRPRPTTRRRYSLSRPTRRRA